MSLKQRLLSYLERNYPKIISSGELQRLALEAGYFGSNATRRLRELENENKVLVFYGEKNAASYQYNPKEIFTPHLCPESPCPQRDKESADVLKNGCETIYTPAPVCPPEKINPIQTKLI